LGYSFYLISKEWFETTSKDKIDARLNSPENSIYVYYFLCIAINLELKKIIQIELFYD